MPWLYGAAFLLLFCAAGAVYWPGLTGAFVFDDFPSIVDNPSLRLFNGSLSSLVDASLGAVAGPLGRPLSMASFALNYFFAGEDPYSYKLTNLAIHLVNGVLVAMLMRQLWSRFFDRAHAAWPVFWVTAVWLLHPVNLTPVLFVVQRMTGLASLFTLAALSLYLHARQSRGYRSVLALVFAWLVCWPAGLLSKETALTFPLLVLLCEWLVLGGFRNWSVAARRAGMFLLIGIAAGLLVTGWTWIEHSYRLRDFTLAQRLLTELRVLWLYVGQILVPWPEQFGLHHDDIVVSQTLLHPMSTLAALFGWLAVIGLAFQQRHARPWVSFGIFWFLAGHLLESSIYGLEIAYEHRNYLPSLGIFLALAGWLVPRAKAASGRLPWLTLMGAFLAYCGLLTGLRAAQWGDEYVRTQIEANAHPRSSRTHHDAARAIIVREMPTGYLSEAAYHMARIHFQRAAQYDPRNKAALTGVLYLDCAYGARHDIGVWTDLLQRVKQTAYSLADQSFIQGLSDKLAYGLLCLNDVETEQLLEAALNNPTADGKIRGMLHAVAMDHAAARLGSLPLARRHALAAVESDPGNAILHLNLIRLFLRTGEITLAKQQYAVMLRLKMPVSIRSEVENLGRGLAD
jgi:hypothetical protein